MPWWFWILIWVALAALTLLFLIYCGFRLYRGFTALARDVGSATAVLDRLSMPQTTPDPAAPADVDLAVFADPADKRTEYETGKVQRQERRRVDRVARRIDRGQPIAVRDLPGL